MTDLDDSGAASATSTRSCRATGWWRGRSGNLSARVEGEDLMVIKASGVPFEELTPEHMVVCDFDGLVVEGDSAPSSDAATHGYVYRHMPRRRRRRAHPQRLRHRLGGARRERSPAC